ncbi:MAG: hypothetical protein KGR98_13340 [Verrucomicrobia bacterium]|nr:hypothetical protein [Verrucomicrobiota bacterium]MDE3098320.1 hypothetical protein [Verrucomicrobiota bacterium]
MNIVLFEEKRVRRAWDEAGRRWYFAIVDVIAVLTGSARASKLHAHATNASDIG